MLLRTDDIVEVESLANVPKKLQREVREIETSHGKKCHPDQYGEYTLVTRLMFGQPISLVLRKPVKEIQQIIYDAGMMKEPFIMIDSDLRVPEGENL